MPAARPPPRSRENRTRYIVLGMLSREPSPMSGYAIRQAIGHSVGHFWRESYGQLYPALRALRAEGLVREVRDAGARPRRGAGRPAAAWAISPRGRETLAAWLAEPPALSPPRNEVLLKVFFSGAVPPEVTLRNLAAVGAAIREQQAQLEAVDAGFEAFAGGHPDAPCWRLTLDFGLRFTQAVLAWLSEAERVIGARARAPARAGRPGSPGRPGRSGRAGAAGSPGGAR